MNVIGQDFFVEIAVGMSAAKNTDALTMLSQADKALKQAKRDHKELVQFNELLPIVQETQQNQKSTQVLLNAIRAKRLRMALQPIAYVTGGISHHECLIRLEDDHGEIVSPAYFLDVAKKTRLYHHITLFILQQVEQLIRDTGLSFAVNLSIMDLEHKAVRNRLQRLLGSQYMAERLIFELVESESMKSYDLISDFAKMAGEAGARVAVDDFGSGFSNFEHIARLPVDHIKIDGSLIRDLHTDKKLQLVVASIVNFARSLGSKVTAEYVESAAVAEACRKQGIDLVQGYYLGRPELKENVYFDLLPEQQRGKRGH